MLKIIRLFDHLTTTYKARSPTSANNHLIHNQLHRFAAFYGRILEKYLTKQFFMLTFAAGNEKNDMASPPALPRREGAGRRKAGSLLIRF